MEMVFEVETFVGMIHEVETFVETPAFSLSSATLISPVSLSWQVFRLGTCHRMPSTAMEQVLESCSVELGPEPYSVESVPESCSPAVPVELHPGSHLAALVPESCLVELDPEPCSVESEP